MITKEYIRKLAEGHIKGTGIFLVDARLSSTGRITVLIDRPEGVRIEDCISMSRYLSNEMGEEGEEHELNVSSPGLDMPFLVVEQYLKNEGNEVEVVTNAGEKMTGTLRNVTSGGFDLETVRKQKGMMPVTATVPFNFEDVKSVTVKITFK